MANKYSRFELKPFASQYVDPKSDKISDIYRERFEKNKEKKDLIDQALAQFNVMGGDSHHLDAQKAKVKEDLQGIIAGGNYEDADLVINETLTDLKSNEALLAAEKSYTNRQEELKWRREMTAKGITVLDFGEEESKKHSSWVYNEKTGKYEANIYQGASQPQLDYQSAMKKYIGTIKADATGISQGRMDKLANRILGGYVRSNEGKQDSRNQVELELDQSLPLEQRQEMAYADMLSRIKMYTDQHVHTKAATATAGQKKSSALQQSILGNTMHAVSNNMAATDVLHLKDKGVFDGNILALTSKMIELERQGKKREAQDIRRAMKSMGKNMVANGDLNAEEGAAYQKFEIDHWRVRDGDNVNISNDDLEKVGGLVKYMTEDRWLPDFELQSGGMSKSLQRVMGYYGTALGTSAAAAAGTAGVTAFTGPGALAAGAAAGTATAAVTLTAATLASIGDLGATLIGQFTDNWGNVKDILRPEDTNLGFIDSEKTQLAQNIANLDRVNEALGTKFTEEDVPYLQKKALEYYDYTVNGGEEIHDKVNDYKGDVYEGAMWVPNIETDEGYQANTRIAGIMKTADISQYHIVGVSEESDNWKDLQKTDADGNLNGALTFMGLKAASIAENVPTQILFKTSSGALVLAEPKDNTTYGGRSLVAAIGNVMGHHDFGIFEEVRKDMDTLDEPYLPDLVKSTLMHINALEDIQSTQIPNKDEVLKSLIYNYLDQLPAAKKQVLQYKKKLMERFPDQPEYVQQLVDTFVFDGITNADGVITQPALIAQKIKVR
jgi:hypothetical protein